MKELMMTTHPPHAPRRSRLLRSALGAGAALVALLGATACGDDDSSAKAVDLPAEGEVRLDSPGDTEGGKATTLAPTYEKGQKGTTDLTMTTAITLDGGGQNIDQEVGVKMTMTQVVVDVVDDQATVEMTLDSIDVDAPEGADESQVAKFTDLAGTTLVGTYDERGMQVGDMEVKGGGSMPAELESSFDSATNQAVFPSEPIGIGAKWTTRDTVEASGSTIDVATSYELVELSQQEYVLKVTQDQPVELDVEGADVEGTVTATGEIRGHPKNLLKMDMTYNQKSDFDIEADGESGTMSMKLDLEMKSR